LTGETDLQKILVRLSPVLDDTEYVFCTLEGAVYGDYVESNPIASFQEAEGLTLVMAKDSADKQAMSYEGVFKCISLNVHSSLEAVGLTAAISSILAQQSISANIIAGYFHDHIFVIADDAERALALLQSA
jgi:uncharacterized protein